MHGVCFHMQTTLHIKGIGAWTRQLHTLAKKHDACAKTEGHSSSRASIDQQPMIAFLEGPYGLSSINIESDKAYKIIVLISGGIGVTVNQSICNDLIEAHSRGRKLVRIFFIWVVRDLGIVHAMIDSNHFPTNRNKKTDIILMPSISEQKDLKPSPSIALQNSQSLSVNQEPEPSLVEGQDGNQSVKPQSLFSWDLRSMMTATVAPLISSQLFDYPRQRIIDQRQVIPLSFETIKETHQTEGEDNSMMIDQLLLHTEIYRTSKSGADVGDMDLEKKSHLGDDVDAVIMQGRPDFSAIFSRIHAFAASQGEKRIGVSICGPDAMVMDATKACRETNQEAIKWDTHFEVFNL